MRRSAGMNRSFAGGQISRQAMNRRGFDFGTTSDSPTPLRRDDGGVRQSGSVCADHAVDREHNRPRRGTGQHYNTSLAAGFKYRYCGRCESNSEYRAYARGEPCQ
jgi:hypothetical protein